MPPRRLEGIEKSRREIPVPGKVLSGEEMAVDLLKTSILASWQLVPPLAATVTVTPAVELKMVLGIGQTTDVAELATMPLERIRLRAKLGDPASHSTALYVFRTCACAGLIWLAVASPTMAEMTVDFR